jgi:signal transduction histidine kinase
VQLADAFLKQSKTQVWVEAALWLSAVSIFDYYTPPQINTFIFYATPVFALSWHSGWRSGMLFAIMGVVIHLLANLHYGPHWSTQHILWGIVNRLTSRAFVVMCGSFLRRYREVVRARVETMDSARQLEREIVRASEREQMRIGQDLHDAICQNLEAIDSATESLRAKLDEEGIPQAKTAAVIQKLVKVTMQDARNLARGICPVHMNGNGLSAALQDLVTTTNHLRQASIAFEANDHIRISDPATAMHLYRIAQEALSNAVRHGKAQHIAVRIAYHHDTLAITIADDGCGYSGEATNSSGMGLRTMQYRAQLIGARVITNSVPSRGTSVSCTLQVPPHLAEWDPSDATREESGSPVLQVPA